MATTRSTLLERMKDRADQTAWAEFHKLYSPLLYRFARARGLSREGAEDVRGQCLEIVVRKISSFRYDKRKGGFKNLLFRITSRRIVDLRRKRQEARADTRDLRMLRAREAPPDEIWDKHWEQQHLRYCVRQVRPLVSERDYDAFRMLVFDECSVQQVCARLGINANQVYKAKSRVLGRVRQKLSELAPDISV